MKRVAKVKGISHYSSNSIQFRGKIEFDLRNEVVYYIWTIDSADGELLGMKSNSISLRTIPQESNPFDFALPLAIESINKYRVNRKQVFEVVDKEWQDEPA